MGRYSRNNNRGYLEDLLYQIETGNAKLEEENKGKKSNNGKKREDKKWYQYIFCCC